MSDTEYIKLKVGENLIHSLVSNLALFRSLVRTPTRSTSGLNKPPRWESWRRATASGLVFQWPPSGTRPLQTSPASSRKVYYFLISVSLRFLFDGRRINDDETPKALKMEHVSQDIPSASFFVFHSFLSCRTTSSRFTRSRPEGQSNRQCLYQSKSYRERKHLSIYFYDI